MLRSLSLLALASLACQLTLAASLQPRQSVGACNPHNGILVYVKFDTCPGKLAESVTLHVDEHVPEGVKAYAPVTHDHGLHYTVCISDNSFNGSIYLTDATHAAGEAQEISLRLDPKGGRSQVYIVSRTADRAGKPAASTQPKLQVLAPISNIRFADTPWSHAKLTSDTSAAEVLTGGAHVPLWVDYCY